MALGAVADLVTIGALVPFVALLAGSGTSALPEWVPTLPDVRTAALLFAFAALGAGALRLVLAWASQAVSEGAGHDLATDIHRRLLLQPYLFHLEQHSSGVIAALDKVETLVFAVMLPLVQGVGAVLVGGAIFTALLLIDPLAASVALAGFGLVYALIVAVTRPALKRTSVTLGQTVDERLRLVQDSLGGIRDIILDGSQPLFSRLFARADRRLSRGRARYRLLSTAPRFLVEAAGLAGIALLALWLSGRPGGLAGALPLLGALALGAQRLLPLLQQLYQSWATLLAHRELIADVAQLACLPLPSEPLAGSSPRQFTSALTFEQVSFRYPSGIGAALAAIDLTIPRGSRVAFTGRTGSGKSTLADLAMGLLSPTEGVIRVDGAVLDADGRRAWRTGIAHVPQAIFLTADSLLANVAFGVPAIAVDRARAIDAIRLAQLDEVVAGLAQGIDSPLGERGARLSGGQRQRVGLARAIYRAAPVLVLDEATSALDPGTEAAVLRVLDALQAEGRTIIIIAHRSSALEGCDRVIRLEEGRVVENRAAQPVQNG